MRTVVSASLWSIFLCSFLFTSQPANGSDATGFVRFESCTFFEMYRLEIMHYQGQNVEKTLTFKIPGYFSKDWIEVPAMECDGPDKCDFSAKSKVQILRASNGRGFLKAISGNFAVEFNNGRKLEGSFRAKGIKPPQEIICE